MPIHRVSYRNTTIQKDGSSMHGRLKEFTKNLNKRLVDIMQGPPDHPWITPLE